MTLLSVSGDMGLDDRTHYAGQSDATMPQPFASVVQREMSAYRCLSVSKSVVNDILGLFDLPGRQRMISHSDSVMYRTVLKTFSNGLFLYPNLFSVFCEGSIDATDTADMEGPDSTNRFKGLFWIKAIATQAHPRNEDIVIIAR